MVLRTDDLFLGAFGLLRGGDVRDVEVHGTNGKQVAVFSIEGPGLEEVEREYFHGPCLVNLRLFKSEVARLKSMAFEALRREESRDASLTDQPGADRRHQGPGRSRDDRR